MDGNSNGRATGDHDGRATGDYKRVSFKERARERDPARLIRKKIAYLAGADKSDAEITKKYAREVRAAIQGVKKLALKRHGQAAARLFAEADRLTTELELAIEANPMRDAINRTLVSVQEGVKPCSN